MQCPCAQIFWPVSKLLRRLSCCLRLLQDSRVPLHHGSITSRASLSRLPRLLRCCLRLLQDSRVPLHHGSFIKGFTSPFPSCTHTLTRFLFTYNKNVTPKLLSRSVKTLGFRFTMKAVQGLCFPVSTLQTLLSRQDAFKLLKSRFSIAYFAWGRAIVCYLCLCAFCPIFFGQILPVLLRSLLYHISLLLLLNNASP